MFKLQFFIFFGQNSFFIAQQASNSKLDAWKKKKNLN